MDKRKSRKTGRKQINKNKSNKLNGGVNFFTRSISKTKDHSNKKELYSVIPTDNNTNEYEDKQLNSSTRKKPTPVLSSTIYPTDAPSEQVVVYKPKDKKELSSAIYELKKLYDEHTGRYKGGGTGKFDYYNNPNWKKGVIGSWDISEITDMGGLFIDFKDFNEDISGWKVDNVINMTRMFKDCVQFNKPLDSWNVSKVTNMDGMFAGCTEFNQPLNSWNVSNVTNMRGMFVNCTKFNQPINKWIVSKVTDMSYMFKNASSFNQPLSNWNIDNVENMNEMFLGCEKFEQPELIKSWGLEPKYEFKGEKKHMFTKTPMEQHLKSIFLGGKRKTRKQRHI